MELITNGACGQSDTAYTFVRNNGERVGFTPLEVSFILHEFEKNGWRNEIDYEIDNGCNDIDFESSSVSRNEFIEMCVEEMESKWELNMLGDEPDYSSIVFDVAQSAGIWREPQ